MNCKRGVQSEVQAAPQTGPRQVLLELICYASDRGKPAILNLRQESIAELYTRGLIEEREDGYWITKLGREHCPQPYTPERDLHDARNVVDLRQSQEKYRWKGMRWVKALKTGMWALSACVLVIGSGVGCNHVNRDELATDLDGVRSELRAEQQASADQLSGQIDEVDQRLGGRIDDLELQQAETAERLARLEVALAELESEFDITVERIENGLAFNVPVHFEFDSSTLDGNQTGTLDRFATFYGEFYEGDLITVEGFTDEAGPEEYNQILGKRRAEEVKTYLSEIGGLDPQHMRAISYGESYARLVAPGEYGHKAGWENRRVVLVIDESSRATAPGNPGTSIEGEKDPDIIG